MEDNQDVSKPFWVEKMRVPNEKGEVSGNYYAGYNGKIKVSLGKPVIDGNDVRMSFKTVLPDYIHAKLSGKVVIRIRENFKKDPTTHRYDGKLDSFSKTVTAQSLEGLVKRYYDVIDDFLWVMEDEKNTKIKMIFVKLNSFMQPSKTSDGNGAKMGKNASISYNYFVGYYNGRSIFDIDYRQFNTTTYDKDILKYKMIPWTQERENFFESIYNNFDAMRVKFDEFFTNMDDKNIDTFINSNQKLLA